MGFCKALLGVIWIFPKRWNWLYTGKKEIPPKREIRTVAGENLLKLVLFSIGAIAFNSE